MKSDFPCYLKIENAYRLNKLYSNFTKKNSFSESISNWSCFILHQNFTQPVWYSQVFSVIAQKIIWIWRVCFSSCIISLIMKNTYNLWYDGKNIKLKNLHIFVWYNFSCDFFMLFTILMIVYFYMFATQFDLFHPCKMQEREYF